jgi:hypothetical protein
LLVSQVLAMTQPKFFCYRQAYLKKKAEIITEEEYYHHIFQHLVYEHDCDQKELSGNDVLEIEIKEIIDQSWQLIKTGEVWKVLRESRFEEPEHWKWKKSKSGWLHPLY